MAVAALMPADHWWVSPGLGKGSDVNVMSQYKINWQRLALLLSLSCNNDRGEIGSVYRERYLIARGFDSVTVLSNRFNINS